MANWDFVFPYTQESADWLKQQGCIVPPVKKGNRLPTTGEMKSVLAAQGSLLLDYPSPGDEDFFVYEQGHPGGRNMMSVPNATGGTYDIQCLTGFSGVIGGFDWSNDESAPQDSFKIRWMCELQVRILVGLCQYCGQLLMWPDTGEPAVIFQIGMDAAYVASLHSSVNDWPTLIRELYGGT